MAKTDKDKQESNSEEELLTPVGPGSHEEPSTDEDEAPRNAADESDEPPEGEEDDERVGHADEEEALEQRKHSRREQRKHRKERYKRDQVELKFLRNRNEQLERRFSDADTRMTQGEVLAIEGRIAQVEDQIRQAEDVHAQALDKGAGADATEALRIRDSLRDGLQQLNGLKQQTINGARQRANTQQNQIDPQVQERAREWASENSDWFDPQLTDEASTVAFAVEQKLFREGRLDPRSDAYYAELDRRLKKRLPEVYRDDADERDDDDSEDDERGSSRRNGNGHVNGRKTSGGPTFRTGGRERSLKKGEVFVDADRRKAMEDMGVWEDPVLRERYLKSYQRYDREHGRRRH